MSQVLSKLLVQDESETLDFKREISLTSDKQKAEFAKDVSAFANTKGGYIIYGKEDPEEGGKIVGIDPKIFDESKMQQVVAGRCYPPTNFQAKLVPHNSLYLVILRIPESSMKPHQIVQTGQIFVRRGSTTQRATREEIRVMFSLAEGKGVEIEPESGWEKLVFWLGKRILIKVSGSLNISLTKPLVAIILIGILSIVGSLLLIFRIENGRLVLITANYSWWTMTLIAIWLIIGIFLIQLPFHIMRTRCPICKSYFSYRRVKSQVVEKRSTGEDREEWKVRNSYRCDVCQHEKEKFEYEEHEIV